VFLRPALISVSGLASNVGKTTLVCDLLKSLPGWEAIKISRGHYRSCGKSREACCVSHLLSDEPIVRSGRDETFESGKDTGRYWDSGASNVHWVICTDAQLEGGLRRALDLVRADGAIIEGTSLLKYLSVDFSIMVTDPLIREVKSSAARVINRTDALFVNGADVESDYLQTLEQKLKGRGVSLEKVPIYTRSTLDDLVARVGILTGGIREIADELR
jgi:hypothetical protein